MTVRILFLGNNWVGWQTLRWLKDQGEEIAGLVLHPRHRQKFGDEILGSAGVDPKFIFDGACLREAKVLESIRALKPDIGVSVFFGYILRPDFLAVPPAGYINLHPSFLPFNRGAHPNVWSILEGTPAGATLHYLDPSVDTGDIIAQRRVEVEPTDTAETLYRRLEYACVELFAKTWPLVREGKAPRVSQIGKTGTSHRVQDVDRVDEIDTGS
ncbi:MAG: formyl transferase [Deltaproteobacteria bacterium]|nr:formyl transferase [Deltaproteobacteria bacterium]